MKYTLSLILLSLLTPLAAQLYFPPNNTDVWETTDPSELGWCEAQIDSLYQFLDDTNTKAFLILKDGRIVLEQYFDGHTASNNWYWASAGKTLTAFAIGVAQAEGYLAIDAPTQDYLGNGWTNCSAENEAAITIRHQLTMSTGLDDGGTNVDCTDPECLQCLTLPAERWAYHNGPYTLLTEVITNATGQNYNLYIDEKIKIPTGMNGAYIQIENNRVFWSTARSMARFGLLVLADGNWNGTPILSDTDYLNAMLTPSQSFNESYGYLWWLNGQNSYMLPQTQFVFPGQLAPDAPTDMLIAAGKNGQFINVVPSQNLVLIRMGDAPDNSLVPTILNNQIWQRVNALACDPTSTEEAAVMELDIFPNPTSGQLTVSGSWPAETRYQLLTLEGRQLQKGSLTANNIILPDVPAGVYCLRLQAGTTIRVVKVVVEKP